jgi:hypothetical protein
MASAPWTLCFWHTMRFVLLLFLIFWWISSFGVSFLYELMMDACCMWLARFDKIPLFLVSFLSLFSGHTVQSFQIWRRGVVSSSCHSTKRCEQGHKARLQIVQNEYKPLVTSTVLLLHIPTPVTNILLLLRLHQHLDCQTVRFIALAFLMRARFRSLVPRMSTFVHPPEYDTVSVLLLNAPGETFGLQTKTVLSTSDEQRVLWIFIHRSKSRRDTRICLVRIQTQVCSIEQMSHLSSRII